MENNRGEQSSEKNISGRKRPHPHAPTRDTSTSAGPTGRNSPAAPTYHAAATYSCAVLKGSTAPNRRTIPTDHSAPTSHTTPTSRTSPTSPSTHTGPTIPTGHTPPTGPTSRITRTGPATPTGLTAPTRPTGPPTIHATASGRAAPTGPTICGTPIRHAAPTSRSTPTGRVAPTSRAAAPTGPAISTGRSTSSSSTAPTGPAIGIRPTVSNRSAVPTGRTSSTSPVPSCNTGPTYSPLLKLQAGHRSQCVIERVPLKPLFTREHIVPLPWDPRYEEYVIAAGLYGIHKIGHIPTDHALISALVERWRQETHTFHFPVGEMTITLQDAAVLLGLRVDGNPICLRTDRNWEAVVNSLLGRVDGTTFRPRSRVAINISWLHEHFSELDPLADDETVQQFARAYCFVLVGSLLFTDHSGDSISAIYLPLFTNFKRAGEYSWASGVLAYLYKELCLATMPTRKQFGGSVMLLQLWSWERLPMGRPAIRRNVEPHLLGGDDLVRRPPLGYVWSTKHQFADYVPCRVTEPYRREIDGLTDAKVRWLPYEGKMDLLPANCTPGDRKLWRTTAPLIHFWIVEMHNPGRVARQFDRFQRIPPYLRDTQESLHDLINGIGANWPIRHQKYLQLWGLRQYLRWREQRPYDHSRHEEFMTWFSAASIVYLTAPGGVPNTSSSAERITLVATNIAERFRDVADEDLRAFFRQQLHTFSSAIKDLLVPINDNSIFAAFDGDQPQQQEEVIPVPEGAPRPWNRARTKRVRGSASTSR